MFAMANRALCTIIFTPFKGSSDRLSLVLRLWVFQLLRAVWQRY